MYMKKKEIKYYIFQGLSVIFCLHIFYLLLSFPECKTLDLTYPSHLDEKSQELTHVNSDLTLC